MTVENISFLLLNFNNNPITNAPTLPTAKVRRVADNFIYDWDDAVFKSTGWGTRLKDLTEISSTEFPGVYETALDLVDFNGLYYIYVDYDGNLATPGDNQSYVVEYNVCNGTTSVNQLKEIHNLSGLDSTQPLVVNPTSRTAGTDITQTIVDDNGEVTVTRT